MMIRKTRRRRGQSIIEYLIVAGVLIAFFVLGLGTIIGGGLDTVGNDAETALNDAGDRVDQINLVAQ